MVAIDEAVLLFAFLLKHSNSHTWLCPSAHIVVVCGLTPHVHLDWPHLQVVRPIGSQSVLNALWVLLHLYFDVVSTVITITIQSPKTHFSARRKKPLKCNASRTATTTRQSELRSVSVEIELEKNLKYNKMLPLTSGEFKHSMYVGLKLKTIHYFISVVWLFTDSIKTGLIKSNKEQTPERTNIFNILKFRIWGLCKQNQQQ